MARHRAAATELAERLTRVDDRRVLNGIFWILRSGGPWREFEDEY
jgi:transposase